MERSMMEERFSARMFLDHVATQRGISIRDIDVAPVVVLAWSRRVIQSLADAVGAQPASHWFHEEGNPLYTGYVQGRRVSFVYAPVGAPGTVALMEELIACGARVFVGFGLAGSLQESAPVGTLLIPTSCVREEGTSLHYVGDEAALTPDVRLLERLRAAAQAEGLKVICGVQWTTDAIYRELHAKIESYRQRGVFGVDMETSAMYALGQFRRVQVCNLLVVSDELWREWRPAFGSPELGAARAIAGRVIVRCLEHDLVGT
jgi:uridine phosphorylase